MRVVQFIHPGSEARVRGGACGWNTSGNHYRKLLCHSGDYIDANNNRLHDDNLCFWNEFEAPTNPSPTYTNLGWEYARYYHRIIQPIQPSPNRHGNCLKIASHECCDNTDPCVFGDTFKYSNCQQVPGGHLWDLPKGSLILFGSFHARAFYLDTVFVTRDLGIRYSVPVANNNPPFVASPEYKVVTLNNLMPRRNTRNRTNPIINEFMFYRGRLPVINSDGHVDRDDIFSFTPARILNDLDYNKRCGINLAALNAKLQHVQGWRGFSPGLMQGHKTIVFKATQVDVKAIWREVRDAVRQNSFELGYHFAW